jgi:hypothetical protein
LLNKLSKLTNDSPTFAAFVYIFCLSFYILPNNPEYMVVCGVFVAEDLSQA